MNQSSYDAEIEKLEAELKTAESQHGAHHHAVASCLISYASILKANKIRLLDAANMEARANVIMDKTELLMEKQIVTEDVPVGLKKCPYCAEFIRAKASLCKHCHSDLASSSKLVSDGAKETTSISGKPTSGNWLRAPHNWFSLPSIMTKHVAILLSLLALTMLGLCVFFIHGVITWNSLMSQASLQFSNQHYDEAAKSYAGAASSAEHRGNKPQLWASLMSQGNVLIAQAKLKDAELCYKRVFDDNYEVGESSNRWLACGMEGLGKVYIGEGKYSEAEKTFQRVLAIKQRASGKDGVELAAGFDDLSIAMMSQGNDAEAQQSLEHALTLRQTAFENSRLRAIEIIESMMALARFHAAHNANLNDAEALLQKAITMTQSKLGTKDPHAKEVLLMIAGIYITCADSALGKKNNEKATEFLNKALEIEAQALGSNSLEYAVCLDFVGSMYSILNDYPKAIECNEKSLKILETSSRKDLALQVAESLRLHYSMGKKQVPNWLWDKIASLTEQVYGKDSDEVGSALKKRLDRLDAGEQNDSAILLWYQRILAIWEKRRGPNHPSVIKLRSGYEELLRTRKQDGTHMESSYENTLVEASSKATGFDQQLTAKATLLHYYEKAHRYDDGVTVLKALISLCASNKKQQGALQEEWAKFAEAEGHPQDAATLKKLAADPEVVNKKTLKNSVSGWSTGSINISPSSPQGENAPSAANLDFGPYMADLQRRIQRAWFPPRDHESDRVQVIFKVHSPGDLTDLRIQRSSGVAISDQAALQSVQNAAPFRPLPAGSPAVVDIQFTFDYNVFAAGRSF